MSWSHLALEVKQAETVLGMLDWTSREASSAEAKREAAEALPGAVGRLRWALGDLLAAASNALDRLPLVEEPLEPAALEVGQGDPRPVQEEKIADHTYRGGSHA